MRVEEETVVMVGNRNQTNNLPIHFESGHFREIVMQLSLLFPHQDTLQNFVTPTIWIFSQSPIHPSAKEKRQN